MKLSRQAILKICEIAEIADENWDEYKQFYMEEKLAELNLVDAPRKEIGKRYTLDNIELDAKE